jgi:hypothetical protein
MDHFLAGVGLGGIVSALAGAKEVCLPLLFTAHISCPETDTVRRSPLRTIPRHPYSIPSRQTSQRTYQWGSTTTPLESSRAHSYTRILAADCLWMPWEHESLAKSMLHFLAETPEARILCIAGFHTGRAKVAPFFEEVVPQQGLEVEEIYEMDADGKRRPWAKERDGGTENIGERKKWLVLARIRRRQAS